MGIGLMPWDSKMYNILKQQDHLYTLLSRGHTGSEARVVGSIVDFMFAPEDHQAVIDKVLACSLLSLLLVTAVGDVVFGGGVGDVDADAGVFCGCGGVFWLLLFVSWLCIVSVGVCAEGFFLGGYALLYFHKHLKTPVYLKLRLSPTFSSRTVCPDASPNQLGHRI